jgi:hypothetical protein
MFLFDEVPPEVVTAISPEQLWYFLPFGYVTTILIETLILVFLLPSKLSLKQRLFCGVWLTACTYPIVVLVLPPLLAPISWVLYLVVAEIFAPVGECLFFWLGFRGRSEFESRDWIRAFVAIIVANLASFGIGEILNHFRWFGLF